MGSKYLKINEVWEATDLKTVYCTVMIDNRSKFNPGRKILKWGVLGVGQGSIFEAAEVYSPEKGEIWKEELSYISSEHGYVFVELYKKVVENIFEIIPFLGIFRGMDVSRVDELLNRQIVYQWANDLALKGAIGEGLVEDLRLALGLEEIPVECITTRAPTRIDGCTIFAKAEVNDETLVWCLRDSEFVVQRGGVEYRSRDKRCIGSSLHTFLMSIFYRFLYGEIKEEIRRQNFRPQIFNIASLKEIEEEVHELFLSEIIKYCKDQRLGDLGKKFEVALERLRGKLLEFRTATLKDDLISNFIKNNVFRFRDMPEKRAYLISRLRKIYPHKFKEKDLDSIEIKFRDQDTRASSNSKKRIIYLGFVELDKYDVETLEDLFEYFRISPMITHECMHIFQHIYDYFPEEPSAYKYSPRPGEYEIVYEKYINDKGEIQARLEQIIEQLLFGRDKEEIVQEFYNRKHDDKEVWKFMVDHALDYLEKDKDLSTFTF